MTNLLASEFLKVRTTRAFIGIALAALAITAVATAGTVGPGLSEGDGRDSDLAGAAAFSLFLATVLGILLITNEFRHGTITQTLLYTPRREQVLAAKLVISVLAGLVLGLIAAAAMLLVATPWLATRDEPLQFDGELFGALGRLLLAAAISGALGLAIGAAVRSQVWALVATFVWFLVLEPIVALVGLIFDRDDGYERVAKYLPGSAIDAITSRAGADASLFGWHTGALLALLYVAGLGAVGLTLVLRQDAD